MFLRNINLMCKVLAGSRGIRAAREINGQGCSCSATEGPSQMAITAIKCIAFAICAAMLTAGAANASLVWGG
jgi:hypothetical protein